MQKIIESVDRPISRQANDHQDIPYLTQSLCPECLTLLDARIYEENKQIFMKKSCRQHGHWKELISTDAKFYKLMLQRDKGSLRPVTNPLRHQSECPLGCGICEQHSSNPMMINIDLTNRCNLNCPICFANASAKGKLVEWNMEQLRQMLDRACEINDVPPVCLQFTGGEPTTYPHYLQALEEGKKRGFAQVQTATNGLKFAQSKEFCHQASQAGLNIAYLQFDGLDDEIYRQTRGKPLRDIKQAALNNLNEAGIRSVLVPTLVKGVNDKEIGPIMKFTLDNIEKITGISWQPVSFTGRIDYEKRIAQRFTMTDLAREVQQQTGLMDMYRDWYPFSFADPFARLVENLNNEPRTRMTCNASCGAAGYLIVDKNSKKTFSVAEFVDVDPLIDELEIMAAKTENSGTLRKLTISRQLNKMRKYYRPESAPPGWTFEEFVEFMMDFVDFNEKYPSNEARRNSFKGTPYRALLVASMHFQDVYNYQLDRLKKCVVHYAAPNGKIYPFCSYNCGPCHRQAVEEKFAVTNS